ncbi:MAG TPA: hypothetical protein VED59_02250, partial [Acidimicrobiales bacterium]|nr:hypothetical protein [Acidimicrobiales bacterium]
MQRVRNPPRLHSPGPAERPGLLDPLRPLAVLLCSPLRIGAAATVVGAVFALLRVEVAANGNVAGLVVAGSAYVHHAPHTSSLPIMAGTGYDGQFYYRMALAPLNWSRNALGIHLDTLARLDRISYPAIVWLLSAGQASAAALMMVMVNVAGLGVLAGLSSAFAQQAGQRPLWGLLVAGFWGFLWTVSRDLTELTAAVFVMAGLLALRKGRPVVAGAALAVAVLAREPALVVVGAVFVSRAWDALLGTRKRARAEWRGGADATWVLPCLAFAGWQLLLHSGTGHFPALSSGGANLALPFTGLAGGFNHYAALLPRVSALLWFGELGVMAAVAGLAALCLRAGAAPLHERIAWMASILLAVTLARG